MIYKMSRLLFSFLFTFLHRQRARQCNGRNGATAEGGRPHQQITRHAGQRHLGTGGADKRCKWA